MSLIAAIGTGLGAAGVVSAFLTLVLFLSGRGERAAYMLTVTLNLTVLAAAVGVAMVIVGAIQWLLSLVS